MTAYGHKIQAHQAASEDHGSRQSCNHLNSWSMANPSSPMVSSQTNMRETKSPRMESKIM